MQNDLLSGQRLRFEVDMYEGESVPGAIARGVHEHVLFCTRPVLDAAGVKLRNLGHSQLAAPEELDRLAYVTRFRPEILSKNAGKRLAHNSGSRGMELNFSGHILPSVSFELNRRRIAPRSLRARNYHRLTWMNLLLPYCPESLERMVEICSNCQAMLGWHYAQGIGVCEYCDHEIMPSAEPDICSKLAVDYRLFANLSSADVSDVAKARPAVASTIRQIQPHKLVRLALALGGIVQDDSVVATARATTQGLPGPIPASVAAKGFSFLRDWPTGFQTWVANQSDRQRDEPKAVLSLRSRLRRLVSGAIADSEIVSLIDESFPDLRKHAVHGFSLNRRYYLYEDVRRHLGIDTLQMEKLRAWPDLNYRSLSISSHFRKGQFDADQIDEMAPAFRNAISFNSAAGRLKLPLYAIEQCCRPKMLVRETHPGFEAVKGLSSLRLDTILSLQRKLTDAQTGGAPPTDAVSLSVAIKCIGGRLKPWGSILQALADGNLPFWHKGDAITARSIFVRPADVQPFQRVSDNPREFGILPSLFVSQADAAEILNIKSDVLCRLSDNLNLHFTQTGRALTTSIEEVLRVASQIVWDKEISWHLGVEFRQVKRLMAAHSIHSRSTGWCRRQLVENSILPDPSVGCSR